MAPTPTENNLSASPTSTMQPSPPYWSKANIAFTAVASALTLGVLLGVAAFFINRHRQRAKLAQTTPDKAGLLSGDERKSNMFSRERHSSVAVYVDSAADTSYKPVSQEPVPLVPLHIAGPNDTGRPTLSTGSGVSSIGMGSIASSGSLGTRNLSPISDVTDSNAGSSHSGRIRSASGSSMRYYSIAPADPTIPVPKIVHTMSD